MYDVMKIRITLFPFILFLLLAVSAVSQNRPLVAGSFDVPGAYEDGQFIIRPLIAHTVTSDHSSPQRGPDPNYRLPVPALDMPANGFPDGQNSRGMDFFQRRINQRRSYAYPVVNPDNGKMIGCVYLNHSADPAHDAEVTWWIRTGTTENSLYQAFAETVKEWVNEEWPFRNPSFKGRAIALGN